MSRVSVNKDLIDNLADSIRNKFDEDSQLSLADMKDVVDDIPKRSSTDLTSSGATVTAPAGYYANDASKSVNTMTMAVESSSVGTLWNTINATPTMQYINFSEGYNIYARYARVFTSAGTAGTPTATKGTVSNHQVTVTPSVTNTTGYITGSTINGTAVTVTASELASGSKSISENGTGIDVVGYSTVDVAVPSSGGTIFPLFFTFSADKTRVNFTTSYADAKEAGQNNARFVYINDEDEASGRYTGIHSSGWSFEGTTFSEGISFDLQDWDNGIYSVAWGYVNGTLTTRTRHSFPTGTVSITSAGEWNVTGASTAYVQAGSDGTPSAIKGSVSNHSISVTPSVTNTTGWISGSTKNGVPVTVTASELVSGTKTITASGNTDVTNYATASVAAQTLPTSASSSATSGYTSKATITPSSSTQYINIPTGYNASGAYYTISAAGATGLIYESGTWTPASDISDEYIYFTNTHSTPPLFAMLVDATGTASSTTYTNYAVKIANFYGYTGYGIPYGTSDFSYGYVERYYRQTGTYVSTSTQRFAYTPDVSGESSTYYSYWISNTYIRAYTAASSCLWRSGRTYKWIAVWPPET